MAHELGVLKLGEVSLEGTKIAANASKHHALNWGYAERLEPQLKAEVQILLEREAAILTTLNPGAHTAIVRGAGSTIGNALIEVYEVQ